MSDPIRPCVTTASTSHARNLRMGKWTRAGRATVLGLCVGTPIAAGGLLLAAQFAFAALPPVPTPSENQFSEEKRVLGKILFFDEQLSTSNVVSCATCHVSANAGADPRLARNPGDDNVLNTPDDILGSPGILRSDANDDYESDPVFALRPQITGRAANTPINAAYAPQLFWDGRASGHFVDPQTGLTAIANGGALESQAVGPVVNNVEMAHAGVDWSNVAERLSLVRPLNLATNHPADVSSALTGRPSYPELFRRAFGDPEISAKRIAFAIATYERTLISDQTPWDRFQAGDTTALTPQQQQGFAEFQARHCNDCHTAPLFSSVSSPSGIIFRNIGLRPPTEDNGLQSTTGNNADRGKFKVPSLRNVGLKRSFMHNGQFPSLQAVLGFYARAPGSPPQFPDNQDPIMRTIAFPPQVANLIQDFIANGLRDPRVANQTFPFDRATLFTNRPANQATILNGTGSTGSGGVVPIIIAQAPPIVGNREFRLGLDGALGGTTARLGVSETAPVGGRITPTRWFEAHTTSGSGPNTGVATQHWALVSGEVGPGQVLFAQWFVTDPAAAGGEATSAVARIPFFCGSSGCPTACSAADFDADGFLTGDDYDAYVTAFELGDSTSDFDGDGFVTGDDFDAFLVQFQAGC